MKQFTCIQVKKKTAYRFREYSKKIAKTHTRAIEVMLDFFEGNKISPYEDLSPTVSGLESLIKKRINGLVAILRNIEIHQTLPTQTMMQLLFEGNPPKEKKILVEKKSDEISEPLDDRSPNERLMYDVEIENLSKKNDCLKKDLRKFIEHSTYVKTTFGKGYYKLNISKEEFEEINLKLKNVYNNYSTKPQ